MVWKENFASRQSSLAGHTCILVVYREKLRGNICHFSRYFAGFRLLLFQWIFFLSFLFVLLCFFFFVSFMLFQDKWAILINCQCRSYRLSFPHFSHWPFLFLSLSLTASPFVLISFVQLLGTRFFLSPQPTIFSLFVAQSAK